MGEARLLVFCAVLSRLTGMPRVLATQCSNALARCHDRHKMTQKSWNARLTHSFFILRGSDAHSKIFVCQLA